MADFTDRIKLIVDVTTDQAAKGFGDIKSGIGNAEGAFGKLKAAGGGAMDALAQNASLSMAGIATGVAAFVKSAVGEFQQLALEANNFGDAVGLSVEDASRWMEVAGDVGVNVQTLEGAVNKLNIAASKGALTELGIGGDTTNERLLNALKHLQGIDSASERAKQGMALFGKSWTELAPLVETSEDLEASLAAVSDAKVINEEEVKKAKDFRDAMDELNGIFEDFKLTVGGELIGSLAQAATALNDVKTTVDDLINIIPGLDGGLMGIATGPLRNVTDGFETLTSDTSSLTERGRGFGQMITGAIPGPLGSWASGLLDVDKANEEAAWSTEAATKATQAQAEAAAEAVKELQALTTAQLAQFNSNLALEDASDRTTTAIANYTTKNDVAAQSSYGNAAANDEARRAMNDAEQAALAQAAAADKAAKDNATMTGANYDGAVSAGVQADALRTVAGTLAEDSPLRKRLLGYVDDLDKIAETKHTTIDADTSDAASKIAGLTQSIFDITSKIFHVKIGATVGSGGGGGGGSSTGQSWSVAPPPALVPAGARGLATTALGAPRASSGPTTVINVHVAAAPLTHPAEVGRQVANYLDAFYRRNGTRLRAVP